MNDRSEEIYRRDAIWAISDLMERLWARKNIRLVVHNKHLGPTRDSWRMEIL